MEIAIPALMFLILVVNVHCEPKTTKIQMCTCLSKFHPFNQAKCKQALNKCKKACSGDKKSLEIMNMMEEIDCDEYELCWLSTAVSIKQGKLTKQHVNRIKSETNCIAHAQKSKCARIPFYSCFVDTFGPGKCANLAQQRCKKGEQLMGRLISGSTVKDEKLTGKEQVTSGSTVGSLSFLGLAIGIIASLLMI